MGNPDIKVEPLGGVSPMSPEERKEYERFTTAVSDPQFMQLAGETTLELSEVLYNAARVKLPALVPEVAEDYDGPNQNDGFVAVQITQEFCNAALTQTLAAGTAASLTDVLPELQMQLLRERVQAFAQNLFVMTKGMLQQASAPPEAAAPEPTKH
jgi:hypothetical protein